MTVSGTSAVEVLEDIDILINIRKFNFYWLTFAQVSVSNELGIIIYLHYMLILFFLLGM